jgi:hypothetical protein
MPVREEEKLRLDAALSEPIAGAIRSIEKDKTFRSFDQIAVGIEESAAECLVAHVLILLVLRS